MTWEENERTRLRRSSLPILKSWLEWWRAFQFVVPYDACVPVTNLFQAVFRFIRTHFINTCEARFSPHAILRFGTIGTYPYPLVSLSVCGHRSMGDTGGHDPA